MPTTEELRAITDPTEFEAAIAAERQGAVDTQATAHATALGLLNVKLAEKEANTTKILDEKKPLDRLLQARGIKGVEELEAILSGKSKDNGSTSDDDQKEAEAQARVDKIMQGTLQTHQSELKERDLRVEELGKIAETSVKSGDKANLRADLIQATTGKGKPKVLPALFEFLEKKVAALYQYEDIDSLRVGKASYGKVPILDEKGNPANVAFIVKAMYASKGARGWDENTADFFASNGTGTGTQTTAAGQPGVAVTPEMLGQAKNIKQYRELKSKLSA